MSATILLVGKTSRQNVFLFAGCGLAATPCLNGGEALRKLKESGPYSAVLCDFEIPDIDTLDLVGRIRQEFPDLPLLVLIPADSLREGMLALLSGATAYIRTPLQPGIIPAALDRALMRKRMERALRSRPQMSRADSASSRDSSRPEHGGEPSAMPA